MSGLLRVLRPSEHRYCRENLSAYLDGRLTPQEQARLERHVQECPACRWEMETLRQTIQALHALPHVPAPRYFRLPHTMPAPSLPFWMRPAAYGAMRLATGIAAALLIVALAGQILVLPDGPGGRSAVSEPVMFAAEQVAGTGEVAMVPATAVPKPPNGERMLEGTPSERGEKSLGAGATGEASAQGVKAGPTTGPTEYGLGAAPPADSTDQGIRAEPAAGANPPTLTPEEAARATAAPAGMGPGTERVPAASVTPAPAATDAPRSAAPPEAAATPAAAVPTVSAPAAAPGLAADTVQPEQPHFVETDGTEQEHLPARERMLPMLREQLEGYPWTWFVAGSALSLVVLVIGTLWLRRVRTRWP
jgi:hypothetical protein